MTSPHRLACLAPLLLAALCANLVHAQPLERQIDALFSQYTAATPGVALAIVRDGQVALLKAYGSANLEHGVPLTPTTPLQAGSVSKQFTAFAIYLLEKQAKLSLADDIRKHLPEFPAYGQPVRIQHLLAHTSGIRDQAALLTLAGGRMDDVITTGQVLRLISRQRDLNFPPGSAYLYSNSGYTLLAEIVQRVSGQSLADYTRQHIFEPLGMHHTRFVDDYEMILRNRADSYYQENGTYKRVILSDSVAGPSNLYTTAADMAKWALNFETPVVGDPALIARFNEPSVLNNGERVVTYSLPGDIGYHAKGQNQRRYHGLAVWSHGGHAGGFRSTFWRFPQQRFAIVLLSNDEHFAQARDAEAVVNLYLKDQLAPSPNSPPVPAAPSKPVPSARLSDFAGRYYNAELETAYTARVHNGKLLLHHLRHGDMELAAAGPDKFAGRIAFPVQLEFRRNAAGQVVELSISNFGAKNVPFAKTPN